MTFQTARDCLDLVIYQDQVQEYDVCAVQQLVLLTLDIVRHLEGCLQPSSDAGI